MRKLLPNQALPLIFLILLMSADASAAIDNSGLLDNVSNKYLAAASQWSSYLTGVATNLFWILVVISMVWTFGMMALRKADIGEFFAEFVRFTITTGFFLWLLRNGPAMAASIIDGLMMIGSTASTLGGFTESFKPSGIIDIGFIILGRAFSDMSVTSPVASVVGVILGLGILVLTALIAINMLLLLISAWVLAYAGIFFLGFGGGRWTSDMAINYYKTVLGLAAQLMTMILLIGIGKSIIFKYFDDMESGIVFSEMTVVFISALVLFVLTNKIPGLISGIITGASVGGNGIGAFGAGAAVGAVGMAAAAAATGGAAFAAGAANISGGAQALMAAFKGAQSNVAAGSDITSRLAGAMGGGGDSGGGSDSNGGSPLASAMGLNSSTSGSSSSSTSLGESSSSQSSSSSSDGSSGAPASGSDGGSTQTAGAESSGGGSDSNQPASTSSKLATAGKIAADMGANLAAGMGRAAANKAAGIADSAKARIAETTGGRLAQEISNPGAASQERRDNQDIAKAESIMSQQSRSEQAEEAREFLAQQSAPSFEGDSIGSAGSNSDVNAEEEIAAFRDRNQNA